MAGHFVRESEMVSSETTPAYVRVTHRALTDVAKDEKARKGASWSEDELYKPDYGTLLGVVAYLQDNCEGTFSRPHPRAAAARAGTGSPACMRAQQGRARACGGPARAPSACATGRPTDDG